jgi:hypothetical protein
VAFIRICPQLLDGPRRNGFIRAFAIELNNGLKPDRLKVFFLLRFFERVIEDDFSIKRLAVFPKGRGSELQDSLLSKSLFECTPCRRLGVMRLVDEEIWAVLRHVILHCPAALASDAARRDNHL